MNFIKRIITLIYMILMFVAGALFIILALNVFTPERCAELTGIITATVGGQVTCGIIGGLFVIIGAIAPYRLEKTLRKNRIVAFQNPDGEVTVSLSAIEDYVRKIAKDIEGIKDIRSRVDISRKGINIIAGVSIAAGANIPQITEKIQMEVKNKVQVMLGVEEKINIKIHIKKIAKSDAQEERSMAESISTAGIPYREAG